MRKLSRFDAVVLAAMVAMIVAFGYRKPVHAQAPPAANGTYKYISSATTTTVKPTSGYLHTVTINGGTAGVVTLFDIAAAGCTGTPASGKFATIETIGATNPVTLIYDLATINGICVVTGAATDLTVSFN